MLRLNIIGCGRLGKTLARLWADNHTQNNTFIISDVITQSQSSAEDAIEFIGAGRAVSNLSKMSPAESWLIATPDKYVSEVPQRLLSSQLLRAEDIVFHCSGALPSAVLSPLQKVHAHVASVHPVKSFADVLASVESFAGTWCGIEGDSQALDVLQPAFEAINGHCFHLDSEHKSNYHIANVMVCNYLVALMEVGLRQFELAGVPREQAMQITEPILRGTLDNIQSLGTSKALTGPIARADVEVIERQLSVLNKGDERIEIIYKMLGSIAAELATETNCEQSSIKVDGLDRIKQLFS